MQSSSTFSAARSGDGGAMVAYPLDEFYAQDGRALPPLEVIEADEVPEPYRTLLVHNSDMTSTLEKFHGSRLHLDVLRREVLGDDYFREVVLAADDGETPVEFGAIVIHLNRFETIPRQLILEARLPLGRILNDCHVLHASRPSAFLKITSDQFINTVLRLSGEHVLFGRRNTLVNPQDEPLAEIVEILPPTTRTAGNPLVTGDTQ